jgi:cobalt/nickel transport protein
MKKSYKSLAVVLVSCLSLPVLAHEAWILPYDFNQDQSAMVKAHLQVGELFKGNSQLYNPDKFERLEVIRNGASTPVQGRMGDLPAIIHKLTEPGMHVLLYQSTGSIISYGNWDKFARFTENEGVSWAQQEHLSRGYPRKDFNEIFIRYAKSLITWQKVDGSDTRSGMPFEIVALNNPYLDGGKIRVEVLWKGEPYANAQLSVFSKKPGQKAVRATLRTDAEGRVDVPVTSGTRYLLNSVRMEPLEYRHNSPLWRSHWTSMTLQLPDP